jgi:four helix bundle protein
MRDFRKLKVWQKAHELTLAVYRATKTFPKDELYGLTSQVRRSCASIAANISEACGRHGDGEFVRFLDIAAGSASESEYHLLLARDLCLLDETQHRNLNVRAIEVKQMLTALTQKVRPERRRLSATQQSLRAVQDDSTSSAES